MITLFRYGKKKVKQVTSKPVQHDEVDEVKGDLEDVVYEIRSKLDDLEGYISDLYVLADKIDRKYLDIVLSVEELEGVAFSA